MLAHLPAIEQTVQGMGVLVGTQKPFVRFLVKNWPLALIAGFALFARGRERYQKGELSTYNMMADVGLVLSPLVGLALLNQLAAEDAERHGEVVAAPATSVPLLTPS
jgi:hypothetical protein